jgi:hypothetical protein
MNATRDDRVIEIDREFDQVNEPKRRLMRKMIEEGRDEGGEVIGGRDGLESSESQIEVLFMRFEGGLRRLISLFIGSFCLIRMIGIVVGGLRLDGRAVKGIVQVADSGDIIAQLFVFSEWEWRPCS